MNDALPPEAHPDLLALLLGELPNAALVAAGDHLRGCEACREELVEVAVGHGLLSRSRSLLGGTDPDVHVTDVADVAPLRPLTDADRAAPISAPAPAAAPTPAPAGGRRPLTLLAGAAALVLVGGLGIGVGSRLGDGDAAPVARTTTSATPTPTPTPTPDAAVSLSAVSTADPGAAGRAVMVRDTAGHTAMTLRITGLPEPGDDEYYYAWLLDPVTQKMLPLGQVGATGATFDLDDVLVGSYSAIDVSLESDDGDPAHSVTSVLRGDYDPGVVRS